MTSLAGAVVLILGYLSLFYPAESLILHGSGECGLSDLSFGGRLHVPDLVREANQWERRKIFVFQTHKRNKFGVRGRGGMGRIFVSRGESCDGPELPQYCPMEEENVPCMDSSIPCVIDLGPPPAPEYADPTPLTASDLSYTGLTINRPEWDENADSGVGPVASWMCSIHNKETGQVKNETFFAHELSHTIEFPPETTFAVRVALINPEGDLGPFTKWQEFTLPGLPPAPSYFNRSPLSASDESPAGLTINRPEWNAEMDHGVGPVASWVCSIRNKRGKVKNITLPGDEHSYTIELAAGATFSVRVTLISSQGVQSRSTNWQNFTLPCKDPGLNLRLETGSSKIGNSRLTALWDYQRGSGGCIVVNQTVHYRQMSKGVCTLENRGDLFNKTFVAESLAHRNHTRRKLDPNSRFKVTVTLTTRNGQSFKVRDIDTTAMTAPGTPVIAEPTWVGTKLFRFSWSPLGCDERYSDHDIRYKYDLDLNGPVWMNETAETFVEIGARNGRPYNITVTAISDAGDGQLSWKAGTLSRIRN